MILSPYRSAKTCPWNPVAAFPQAWSVGNVMCGLGSYRENLSLIHGGFLKASNPDVSRSCLLKSAVLCLCRACVVLAIVFLLCSVCILGKAIHNLVTRMPPEVVRRRTFFSKSHRRGPKFHLFIICGTQKPDPGLLFFRCYVPNRCAVLTRSVSETESAIVFLFATFAFSRFRLRHSVCGGPELFFFGGERSG